MAEAYGVNSLETASLKSTIVVSSAGLFAASANIRFNDPLWSIANALITPASLDKLSICFATSGEIFLIVYLLFIYRTFIL